MVAYLLLDARGQEAGGGGGGQGFERKAGHLLEARVGPNQTVTFT